MRDDPRFRDSRREEIGDGDGEGRYISRRRRLNASDIFWRPIPRYLDPSSFPRHQIYHFFAITTPRHRLAREP